MVKTMCRLCRYLLNVSLSLSLRSPAVPLADLWSESAPRTVRSLALRTEGPEGLHQR